MTTLPSLAQITNDENMRKRTIFKSNIQYEPLYNNIYDLQPKKTNDTDLQFTEREDNIFNLSLGQILINIANTIVLILLDLTNINNYDSVQGFLKIFFIQNRLLYFGIFIIFITLFIVIFTE